MLRFHPLVADDLRTATSWYDGISKELGNRFRDAANARFDDVETRPESFGLIDEGVRAALIGKFPYLIVFEVAGSAAEILGIYHSASNPETWTNRKRS